MIPFLIALLCTGCFDRDGIPVEVEKVVYITTEKPCLQWEIFLSRGEFQGKTQEGWEPFAATSNNGLLYRRCIKEAP